MDPLVLYAGFAVLVAAVLALDLGVLRRASHIVGMGEALAWSSVWIALALGFAAVIWLAPGWLFGAVGVERAVVAGLVPAGTTVAQFGEQRALEFLTGYVIEKALSVDNLFVIALIFAGFRIAPQHQHRVLFYGILGAIVLRTAFIFAGVGLITAFHWLIYVFGVFLVVTGLRMLRHDPAPADPADHWFTRLVCRFIPVAQGDGRGRFLVTETRGGRLVRCATPLFLALVMVEFTDLVFAVDSIPAILAITRDPFIVLTSNIFAILGLRSLYFALAGLMDRFAYLSYALAFILVFVGAKMLLVDLWKVPVGLSLGVIAAALLTAIIASLWRSPAVTAPRTSAPGC